MNTAKYVPVLKCKRGEQEALKTLNPSVANIILPLLEIPHSSAVQNATKNQSHSEFINSFWSNRPFYFYFLPEWYSEGDSVDIETFSDFVIQTILPLCSNSYAIPVFDLSCPMEIRDWNLFSNRQVAIRLRNNEFGAVEDTLNPLFSEGTLERKNVDLILDLQYVSADDLFAKKAVLKAALADLDYAEEFHSIVIAAVSFPKSSKLTSVESREIYRSKRIETELYAEARKLSKRFNFNYVYADYGPTDIEDFVFVVGMTPNFKIKYTSFEDYLYIKGISLKKGGLDIGNVQKLAKLLVDSEDYSGEDYSWGDKKIFDIANGLTRTAGNLTSWVSYAMSHHITFIARQV